MRKIKRASAFARRKRSRPRFCASCKRGISWSWPDARVRLFYTVPGPSPCPPLDFAEVYQSVGPSGPRQHWQIAGGIARMGKAFRRRLGISALAGLFHCRQTPGLLSSGKKNLRPCENGSARPPPASRRRCNVIISIFDSTTDSSPTEIKSRLRKSCCNIRSPRREFAKKTFVSSSTRHRTQSRCNFPCCWKRRARRKREGLWLQDRRLGPRPGHFCMVGDFQQSIYWRARGPELLPNCSSSADCRQARREPGICRHVSARPEAARFR